MHKEINSKKIFLNFFIVHFHLREEWDKHSVLSKLDLKLLNKFKIEIATSLSLLAMTLTAYLVNLVIANEAKQSPILDNNNDKHYTFLY
jgi:hypothetical protein